MSLFGNLNQPKPGGGLFSSSTTTTTQSPQTGGLFGNANTNTPAKPTLSLFGPSTTPATQTQQTGGLFAASTSQPQQTGGIFGNTTTQQAPQSGGLFGASTAQPAQQTGGLFGSAAQKPATGGGLFGTSIAQPAQQGGGLFGSTAQKPATSGLFSTSSNPAPTGGGLFGGSTTQPAQSGGLFGGGGVQQQQQQQQQSLAQSFLAGSQAAPLPKLGQSQWTPAPNPREKPILSQMEEILYKWHPNSPTCTFQHYFYQHVSAERAPYFGVPPGEDAVKWEEALKHRPSDGDIPVLAKAFGKEGIAGRLELQTAAISALYERIHEIDASLRTRIEEHDLKFTVRSQDARRRHVALSRRCLALATKVQVLRNRGYALDAAEEELKGRLTKLEQTTFDPVINGRQEELWARMTVVRERAKMLKEESAKFGKAAGGMEKGEFDDELLAKIRQILMDYESQLAHLGRELDVVKKDFEEWVASTKTAGEAGTR